MQNCRRRVARLGSAPRSATFFGFKHRRYFKLYFGIGRLWRGAVLFASKSDALFASTLRASGVDTPRVNPSSGELGKNAL